MSPFSRSPLRASPSSRAGRRARRALALGAIAASFGLTASLALAPPAPPTDAVLLAAYVDAHSQELRVSAGAAAEHLAATGAVQRDEYDATEGLETLIAGGTNHDWAKMVLLFAGYPMTDENVTVITRWMRQENYVDTWWNRNNPLNNGWNCGGGGGTGTCPSLVASARNAADALNSFRGYAGIRAAFLDGTSTTAVEAAIWASPWASGHYNNGAHWHYNPVPVVKAPASAWG